MGFYDVEIQGAKGAERWPMDQREGYIPKNTTYPSAVCFGHGLADRCSDQRDEELGRKSDNFG